MSFQSMAQQVQFLLHKGFCMVFVFCLLSCCNDLPKRIFLPKPSFKQHFAREPSFEKDFVPKSFEISFCIKIDQKCLFPAISSHSSHWSRVKQEGWCPGCCPASPRFSPLLPRFSPFLPASLPASPRFSPLLPASPRFSPLLPASPWVALLSLLPYMPKLLKMMIWPSFRVFRDFGTKSVFVLVIVQSGLIKHFHQTMFFFVINCLFLFLGTRRFNRRVGRQFHDFRADSFERYLLTFRLAFRAGSENSWALLKALSWGPSWGMLRPSWAVLG